MKVHQSMKSELEEKVVQLQEAEKKYSRKVAESWEERELDAQAKKHLQESYSGMLERNYGFCKHRWEERAEVAVFWGHCRGVSACKTVFLSEEWVIGFYVCDYCSNYSEVRFKYYNNLRYT